MPKGYSTQRIDTLLDDKFQDMRDDIKDIKESVIAINTRMVGNGREGCLQVSARLQARQKIILWVLSIIVGGALSGGALIASNAIQNDDAVDILKNEIKNLHE